MIITKGHSDSNLNDCVTIVRFFCFVFLELVRDRKCLSIPKNKGSHSSGSLSVISASYSKPEKLTYHLKQRVRVSIV